MRTYTNKDVVAVMYMYIVENYCVDDGWLDDQQDDVQKFYNDLSKETIDNIENNIEVSTLTPTWEGDIVKQDRVITNKLIDNIEIIYHMEADYSERSASDYSIIKFNHNEISFRDIV